VGRANPVRWVRFLPPPPISLNGKPVRHPARRDHASPQPDRPAATRQRRNAYFGPTIVWFGHEQVAIVEQREGLVDIGQLGNVAYDLTPWREELPEVSV
jgi:hypothetical protein